MANTEGMSDEVMQDLLSTAPDENDHHQTLLKQRMAMPMGERPAATVIRKSKRPQTKARQTGLPTKSRGGIQAETPSSPALPVVGNIVERPVGSGSKKGSTLPAASSTGTTRPKSKFAQHRQNSRATGFPSLDVPLGTFSKTGTPFGNGSKPIKKKQPMNAAGTARKSNDADAMIAQMTHDEISESVDELKSALSPEMVQFLQKRGAQKNGTQDSPEMQTSTPLKTMTQVHDVQEKERLAKVLSSIQTYDDLDEAVEKESSSPLDSGLADQSEFSQACSLLRSTSPRQTLWGARVVCEHLEEELKGGRMYLIGGERESDWPFPPLLPVSLRCLLDANIAHSNELLLHTYVLRSVLALLCLRAPKEHNYSPRDPDKSGRTMEASLLVDTLVVSPFGSLYPTLKATPMNVDGQTVAYSTASSSTSAQTDGENFIKDPMWTLLTRMKVVPRLADILNSRHDIPVEAYVAISGIVTMLSLRSPGAASAICQHETLFANLLAPTVLPPTNAASQSFYLNPDAMLPVMMMLNTMAQQSRVVATQIPHEDILLPLLGTNVDSDQELVHVQLLGLTLWRKLLRYGVGFKGIESLRNIFVMERANQSNSLTTQYHSVFSALLDAIKPVADKSLDRRDLIESIEESDRMILSDALSWLSPLVTECAKSVGSDFSAECLDTLLHRASLLRLVNSFIAASQAAGNTAALYEFCDDVLLDQLSVLVENEQIHVLFSNIVIQSDNRVEALVSCSRFFVAELCSLSINLLAIQNVSRQQSRISVMHDKLSSMAKVWLQGLQIDGSIVSTEISHERSIWAAECHFSIVKMLLQGDWEKDFVARLRAFIVTIIGRLQPGDEAIAAVLFSHDEMFASASQTPSPLSSMFMRELCMDESVRKQLDHSFKLRGGFGITASGWGPFGLESLLSEGERRQGDGTQSLLPLGHTWMWQVLSGSFGAASNAAISDVSDILACTLRLLEEMHRDAEIHSLSIDEVPYGAKVYFLLNIWLYPESIVGDNNITESASRLLSKIFQNVGPKFASEFYFACFDHSKSKHGKEDNLPLEELLSGVAATKTPSQALRAIKEFVSDLTNAFLEYGAQYEESIIAIRSLLRPQFPTIIQCEAIEQLRAVLHLLNLASEQVDDKLLASCVEEFVRQGEQQESSLLLDLLTNVFRNGDGGRAGFFFTFGIVTLAQALIRNSLAMERRLLTIPPHHASIVLAVASEGLKAPKGNTTSMILTAIAMAKKGPAVDSEPNEDSIRSWCHTIRNHD